MRRRAWSFAGLLTLPAALFLVESACGDSSAPDTSTKDAPDGGATDAAVASDATVPDSASSDDGGAPTDAAAPTDAPLATFQCLPITDAEAHPPMPDAAPTRSSSKTGSVAVSDDPRAIVLTPSFLGLSYSKDAIAAALFQPANNASLVALLKNLGGGVFRFGGDAVDTTTWDPKGAGGQWHTVAPADIDAFAAFLARAGWTALYGVPLGGNAYASADAGEAGVDAAAQGVAGDAEEAAYAYKALGNELFGFEIGNEPDVYPKEGYRPADYALCDFLDEWATYAAAIRAVAPGAPLTGPATGYDWAVGFGQSESSEITVLTRHYYANYVGGPGSTSITSLLQPDSRLLGQLPELATIASAANVPYRLAECNSIANTGPADDPAVTTSFGAALWAIDFLFENALNGSTGINFQSGGGRGDADASIGSYVPIADDAHQVTAIGPDYYAMLLFAQVAKGGTLLQARVTDPGPSENLSAYAVAQPDGTTAVVLDNKDGTNAVTVSITARTSVTSATSLLLTAPSLATSAADDPESFTFGGSPVGLDGSWTPKPVAVKVTDGNATATVPAGSALLLTLGK